MKKKSVFHINLTQSLYDCIGEDLFDSCRFVLKWQKKFDNSHTRGDALIFGLFTTRYYTVILYHTSAGDGSNRPQCLSLLAYGEIVSLIWGISVFRTPMHIGLNLWKQGKKVYKLRI